MSSEELGKEEKQDKKSDEVAVRIAIEWLRQNARQHGEADEATFVARVAADQTCELPWLQVDVEWGVWEEEEQEEERKDEEKKMDGESGEVKEGEEQQEQQQQEQNTEKSTDKEGEEKPKREPKKELQMFYRVLEIDVGEGVVGAVLAGRNADALRRIRALGQIAQRGDELAEQLQQRVGGREEEEAKEAQGEETAAEVEREVEGAVRRLAMDDLEAMIAAARQQLEQQQQAIARMKDDVYVPAVDLDSETAPIQWVDEDE